MTSIWQDGIGDFKSSSLIPANDTLFDVIVVGGGITGIATALELKKKGLMVLLCEAHTLGFGTTSGTTAHINTVLETTFHQIEKDFGEKNSQLVAKATREAFEMIRSNVEEYAIDCGYKELPAFIYSQDEKQDEELQKMIESTQKVGISASNTDSIPIKVPFTKAMRLERQAQFHPVRYIYRLATEFEKLGGIIIENCRVTNVDDTEIMGVTTSRGKFRAMNLVYATHIPPGVNLLHFRSAPYRSYAIAAKLKNEKDYPEAEIYDLQDPYHYWRTHTIKGESYLIVGGEDHKTGHDDNTGSHFTKLEAYLRSYYDVAKVAFKWSSQYFQPTDGLAYIGHLPGHSRNMFVATGFGGNGMPYSHITASILRDLVITGDNEYRKLFDPNRIKPVAGFQDFAKEAVDVVGHLVRSVLPKEKLQELADMAPGEGRIVNYEGERLALYKDEEGAVHAVSPACSHIKCSVEWNTAERTWDCPCHGSRYTYKGEMINAPARKDLEMIRVEDLVEK